MKKMLAAYCCILCLKTFAQVPEVVGSGDDNASGKKVLIKAIARIVNTESNRKSPAKKIFVPSSECPLQLQQIA